MSDSTTANEKQLSPADQIMIAVAHVYQEHDGDPPARAVAAAVLAAAADQVVPVEVSLRRGMRPGGTGSIAPDEWMQDQRQETRRRFLAIAAELGALE